MIEAQKLIKEFQTMYQEHWPYVWGKAEKGCVDCSGAFTYAYSLFGKKIAHGSNSIARHSIRGKMLPISDAKPGMAAFKVRVPGEEGYNLPDKYKNSGDLNDYYHIGLVDDDPHYVLNAKGTMAGFCRDELTARNGWDCVAYLKDVEYGKGDGTEMDETMATVVLPANGSGTTVNLREGPSLDYNLVARVPVGATVEVLQDTGKWCQISFSGKTGWMMSNYLEYNGLGGESGGDVVTVAERMTIEQALEDIEKQIDLIRETLGRG